MSNDFKPVFAFDCHVHSDHQYRKLSIEVWERRWASSETFDRAHLEFTWQATVGSKDEDWYAGRLAISEANPERLKLATRLLTRIAKAEVYLDRNPLGVVKVLRQMGMFEGVYDGRLYTFLPLDKVLSPDFHCYMAWRDGREGCNLGQVMARTVEEARPLLVEIVAKYLANFPRYREASERQKYVDWIADPQATIMDLASLSGYNGRNPAPDDRPAEDKITEFQPKPEPAAEAQPQEANA